jgi:PHD/YefM family antitoxin component YafN of YafNO toxin-antitoxin module
MRIVRTMLEFNIMRTNEKVTVSAAEFHRNIGRYQDIALTKPVAITKNGRDRTILLSAEEYNRLKRRDRQVIVAGELSEQEIEAIRAAEVPSQYAHLNDELKDWKP